jgi:predicted outer membrane protein
MLPAVRFVRWAVLGSILVATVVSVVLAGRSPSSPASLSALFGGGTTPTAWGPLSPADRQLLIKVRQVNLWEGPTSEQAAQRARSPAVREVGRKLAIEHAQLDADLLAVAQKLQVKLPSQPNDSQKTWMAAISSASPADYDKRYINLVRSAHGEVMPLVEGVRSGTQNTLVRQFAVETSQFVARHMDYLESTGLVDYSLLPPSTAPVARMTQMGGYNVPITLVLFVIAVVVGAAMLRALGCTRPAAPGMERSRWWARAAAGAVLAASGARNRALRSARERREFKQRMVTTAELIAVLNSPDEDEPDARPVVPAQRGESARHTDLSDRLPPKLGKGSGGPGW